MLSAIEPDSQVEHLTVLESSDTSESYSLPSSPGADSSMSETSLPDHRFKIDASTTEGSVQGDFPVSSTTGSRFTTITADPSQQWPDALMFAHIPIHGMHYPFFND